MVNRIRTLSSTERTVLFSRIANIAVSVTMLAMLIYIAVNIPK